MELFSTGQLELFTALVLLVPALQYIPSGKQCLYPKEPDKTLPLRAVIGANYRPRSTLFCPGF
jgi:hypothetical protein